MVKFVHAIDYPTGGKRAYLEWVRSIAETLQQPEELKQLASYDNVFSASPQRVVEFTFESMEDGARYFERPEMVKIFQADLVQHGVNISVSVLRKLADYTKDVPTTT